MTESLCVAHAWKTFIKGADMQMEQAGDAYNAAVPRHLAIACGIVYNLPVPKG